MDSGTLFTSSSGVSCRLLSDGKDAVSWAILSTKKLFWCSAVSFGSIFVVHSGRVMPHPRPRTDLASRQTSRGPGFFLESSYNSLDFITHDEFICSVSENFKLLKVTRFSSLVSGGHSG